MGLVRIIQLILIDTQHKKYYQPIFPSMSPSKEQFELRELLDMNFHAHHTYASQSDYDGPFSDYTYGHSPPDMESPAASPAVYIALVFPTPTALRFVDVGANISM
jgi:hypothetical protein